MGEITAKLFRKTQKEGGEKSKNGGQSELTGIKRVTFVAATAKNKTIPDRRVWAERKGGIYIEIYVSAA